MGIQLGVLFAMACGFVLGLMAGLAFAEDKNKKNKKL